MPLLHRNLFCTAEVDHRPVNMEVDLFIQLLQNGFQLFLRLERRGEPAFLCKDVFHEPVGDPGFAFYVKTGDKSAAGLQNTPCFPKGLFLIGKGVETVHADNNIKSAVVHRQIAYISLNALDVRQAAQPFLGLRKHTYAVIETRDAGAFQGCPFALREHGRSDRDIQKISGKVVGDMG